MTSALNKEQLLHASDGEILAESQTNPQAFEILVERYQREFIRKAHRITRDNDDAEDIVQDVFVKMYKYAHTYRYQEGATFKSWAYAILTNTCFTYCKRKKRRQEFFMYADDDLLESFAAGSDEDERSLDLNQVKVAIAKIPKLLGRMLTLALSGKSHEEIAALEGVPVGTVRTRLHRAKKAIHKVL